MQNHTDLQRTFPARSGFKWIHAIIFANLCINQHFELCYSHQYGI